MPVDQTTDAAVTEAPPRRLISLQLKMGLVITGSIVLLGLLAPRISPHPRDTISMRARFGRPMPPTGSAPTSMGATCSAAR
jgi:peptide/nickel transport system permease protein